MERVPGFFKTIKIQIEGLVFLLVFVVVFLIPLLTQSADFSR